MTELALDCGAATDTGRVRECNEDRYWMDAARGLFLVVDGVGGQAAGERAAEIAVAVVRETMGERSAAPPGVRVRQAITAANNSIYAAAQKDPELQGMACVLTLAHVDGEQVTVGHVGDSRLYLIELRAIRKVTSDHSPVGEIEDAGELSEEEAMTHPRRHEVFREVGSCERSANEEDFIELLQCEIAKDAALLLCSDGLSDHLTSRRIREIAERYDGDATEIARNLVAAANQAGGRDNITAVFVAGPDFGGRTGATRPRLGVTRLRPRHGMWRWRIAYLSYGLLIGMLLWAALRMWS
ncbi:MAG: protein phosphatase 2C domain-containing protein [Candidatus Solibacter sp.]